MDNKNIYIQRLATYAQHISEINMKKHPKRRQQECVQMCEMKEGRLDYFELKTHSLLLDFHLWFPNDFYWNSKIKVSILKGMDPEENPFSSIIDFLGFRNPREVLHIFSIQGMQSPELYGGIFILEDSPLRSISSNITAFIKSRLAENHAS